MLSFWEKAIEKDFEYDPSLVDLHVHTYPASPCSKMTIDDYIGIINSRVLKIISITDHGSMEGYNELKSKTDVLIIPGIELSFDMEQRSFDILIYSSDIEYLEKLERDNHDLKALENVDRNKSFIVWAHPVNSSHDNYIQGLLSEYIDGIEVFNWGKEHHDPGQYKEALRIMKKMDKKGILATDSHNKIAVGRVGMRIEGDTVSKCIEYMKNRMVFDSNLLYQ